MKNILKYKLIVALFATTLAFCSCGNKQAEELRFFDNETSNGIAISNISFSDDYNEIEIKFNVTSDMVKDTYEDLNKYRIVANDRNVGVKQLKRDKELPAKSIKFLGQDFVGKYDINFYGLVDLSMSADDLDKTRKCLKRICNMSGEKHLFLTFMMSKNKISNIIPASDYVLDNYVCKQSKLLSYDLNDTATNVYLYRGVTECLEKLVNSDTHTHLDTAKRIVMAVFSNEIVFDEQNGYPIDPEHFAVQERMMRLIDKVPSNIAVYHIFEKTKDSDEPSSDNPGMMKILCEKTNGACLNEIGIDVVRNEIMKGMTGFDSHYEVSFDNIEGLLYHGRPRIITINVLDLNNNVVASASKKYSVGSIENVIFVGGISVKFVVISVVLKILLIALILYFIFQFIVPFIQYKIFHKKYVIKYEGTGQYVNSVMVPQSCYYCKAPFEPDEEIVVKCSHVMHKSCWDENDHHCPEYGLNCDTGSHFYDSKHIFNIKNAPYFTSWVLLAIVAVFIQLSIMVLPSTASPFFGNINSHIVDSYNNVITEDMSSLPLRNYFRPFMFFGFAFCLTFMLSLLSTHRRKTLLKLTDTTARALIAGVLSISVHILHGMLMMVFNLEDATFFMEWIPSILSILIIEYSITIKSIARCHHKRFIITALVLGSVKPILDHFFNRQDTIYELQHTLLFSVVTAIVIAIVVADRLPRRQKSILHVSGSIKDFDVALYKWFSQCSHANVTIGKSTDCSLQIFWDLDKDVAPIHASIRMVNGIHRLYVSDNDVEFNGKNAKHNKSYQLHYGDSFKIGKTKFRYMGV